MPEWEGLLEEGTGTRSNYSSLGESHGQRSWQAQSWLRRVRCDFDLKHIRNIPESLKLVRMKQFI